MKKLFILLFLVSNWASAQINELPRSTPEQEGVHSKALIATFDSLMALPETDIHSVMVVRHGKVIGEIHPSPFKPADAHTMFSCSKTFVGTAVGLAISENRLRLTDRVAALLPEFLPDTVSGQLANMTVKDLLQMTSGITPDWSMRDRCSNWIATYLSKEVKQPGSKFQYDSICSYILSAIVQKVTGMTVLDYLKIRIFNPMHITDVEWEVSPEGINTGGWGLRIQSESLAKFGLLLLHQGVWEGRQLIPADWVEQMSSLKMETGGDGYCFQMWRCDYPGAFRLDGAFGQFVIIAPQEDMVIVLTECSLTDVKRQRHIFWNHLLPHVSDQPLPKSSDYDLLSKKQANYALPYVEGKKTDRLGRMLHGKRLLLEPNELGWTAIRFFMEPDRVKMEVEDQEGVKSLISLSYKDWSANRTSAFPPYSIKAVNRFQGITRDFTVAAAYGWRDSELRVKLHYTNWMSALDLCVTNITEQHADIRVKPNYSKKWIRIKGTM